MKICLETEYKSRKEVEETYPSGAVIKKGNGGWVVFETCEEYETWKKQK